jgi:hypothetical protein
VIGPRSLRSTSSRKQPENSRVALATPKAWNPSCQAQDEREVYSVAVLRGERGSANDRSGNPVNPAFSLSFPYCGKLSEKFSIPWKNRQYFFHSVENSRNNLPYCGKFGLFFPQCGKIFSMAWKNPEKVFQTVENRCVYYSCPISMIMK